jgi:hypothetical protein
MITPWGQSQSHYVKADGIVFYSTASHGGYLLSPARHAELLEQFPWFETFAGGRWYEEDCDAAAVTLAFHHEFTDAELRCAAQIADCMASDSPKWAMVKAWLNTNEHGHLIRHVVAEWEKANAEAWEPRGMGSAPKDYERGCWWVHLRRIGDGERKQVVMRGYPTQATYSDAEIAALTAHRTPEGWTSV